MGESDRMTAVVRGVAIAALGAIALPAPSVAQGRGADRIPDITSRIERAQGAINRVPDLAGRLDRAQSAAGRVPEVALSAAGRAASQADAAIANARTARLKGLVRANPQLLDVDRRGAPVVRGEVVGLGLTDAALAAAEAAGFEVARRSSLAEIGVELVTLRAPAKMSTRRAIERLRALDPQGSYEFNHIYSGAGAGAGATAALPGNGPLRVGLVDSGVEPSGLQHRVRVEQKGFANGVRPHAHGTAVARLLLAAAGAGSTLYAADVFGSAPTGGSAEHVARALAWMAAERVPVVNVSLVGPDNVILAAAVRALVRRGHLIVAPVGNDGPAAKPLYPASYPGVIAVTAVDDQRRLLIEAGRATHVQFTAVGLLAGSDGTRLRGTSFASPVVAGRLALVHVAPSSELAASAVWRLAAEAVDLGPAGPDRRYGYGLVTLRAAQTAASN